MRKVTEILRLRWEQQLRVRQVAQSLAISHSTVIDTIYRAKAAGLSWPLPASLDNAALEALLYHGQETGPRRVRPEPVWAEVHRELRRKKHVTLQLLWIEYQRTAPDGYKYTQFCVRYRQWAAALDVVLRQPYRAGEKMFVDFAGQTIPVIDAASGEVREAHLFIAVLGASNYTYAEATWGEDLASWIGAHVHAFDFFEGVPEVVIPDNARTGVTHASYYEPDLNATYHELATHYGTVIIPARPYKPRDKAKAESAVLQGERWLLAPLRDRVFGSLAELNAAIAAQRTALNERPFQKLPGSRRTLFETLDRPALRSLPTQRYEFAQWKKARANVDYHVALLHNYYSVPYQLVQRELDCRVTATTVEVFAQGHRVASHVRTAGVGHYVTDPRHRPIAHQQHLEWTPSRLVRWAETVGPQAAALVDAILQHKPHPEQGYRACLGLMRLAKRYSPARLEAAAARALTCGALSYRSVRSILEHRLDQQPLQAALDLPLPAHPNVRGAGYYRDDDNEEGTPSC